MVVIDGRRSLVIANPDREFSVIDIEKFPQRGRPIIVDAWRFLSKQFQNGAHTDYHPVGIGGYDPEVVERLKGMWGHEKSG